MSLILDALRKADAERERGSVPTLHAQPVVPLTGDAAPQPAKAPAWPGIAIGLALGLAAAVVWMLLGREAPSGAAAGGEETAPVAQAAAPAPAARPPAAASAAAAAKPALPAMEQSPVAEPAPWPQPEERRPARDEAKSEAPVRVLGNVPPAPPPVMAPGQLPPDVRSALPTLTIGGSIYSPEPAARSLIVNGQLFRERDRLTQELTLEEIRLKSAVFSFRGYRFEVLF